MDILTRSILLYLVSFIVVCLHLTPNSAHTKDLGALPPGKEDQSRGKRGFVITKSKPGPLRQVFGIFYEQWNDTRFTLNSINKLFNDQFLPENASLTTTTPAAPTNVTTKPPPFKITRSELLRILRRNIKGLSRLYNLELEDALKQSEITRKQFRANVTKEVAKFL
ncbi:hypothetical protein PPYR_07472 [Photinus pyralis]|uniref:Uncharacterized protein n=1 Tax=Photinus pyralis TaxID=7054 RepID=A0A1Y1JU67_PHOPY|nr:uncharacterized protein LOC116169362 [Photinus pyralis]KAB0799592.1 hypothetical protein PPYR_07472 [Photinus pyralis]